MSLREELQAITPEEMAEAAHTVGSQHLIGELPGEETGIATMRLAEEYPCTVEAVSVVKELGDISDEELDEDFELDPRSVMIDMMVGFLMLSEVADRREQEDLLG